MTTKTIAAGFCIAALTSTAALASGPDEFTLQPIDSTTSTIVYSPETYTSGGTIQTDPVATTGTEGGFEKVNIDDYLVPETATNSQ